MLSEETLSQRLDAERARKREYTRTHREDRKTRGQDAINQKAHHCKACNVSFTDESHLNKRYLTKSHRALIGKPISKAEHAALMLYKCDTCVVGFEAKHHLERHLKTKTHKRKIAVCARTAIPGIPYTLANLAISLLRTDTCSKGMRKRSRTQRQRNRYPGSNEFSQAAF